MRSNILQPEQYDALEKDALARLTNWTIKLGAPLGFNVIGFPTRITSIRELHRYSDTMHETRTEGYFIGMGGLDLHEAKVVKQLKEARDKVLFATGAPKRVYSLAPILSAVNIARLISACAGEPSRFPVFEVAAGSGYLAGALALKGFRVISTDTTQAFYLYQHHLYRALFDNDMIELASEQLSWENGRIVHVPWWVFYTLYQEDVIPPVEIFTCNHALAEMDEMARAYVMAIAGRLLANSKNASFVLEGWGGDVMTVEAVVKKDVARFGFEIAYEANAAALLVPRSHPASDKALNAITSMSRTSRDLRMFSDLLDYLGETAVRPSHDESLMHFIQKPH